MVLGGVAMIGLLAVAWLTHLQRRRPGAQPSAR
jgi:MYXO-CTERM domain-containing protein